MTRTLNLVVVLLLLVITGCENAARCITAGDGPSGQRVLVNIDDQGVALEGYDPVSYFTRAKPVKGDPAITSTYLGATYRFTSGADKATFDADPAKYAPQFGGYCGYAASINTISPVDPMLYQVLDGRLVLQHNQKAWRLWNQDVPGNLAKADQNWPGLVQRNCH
ncbi:MAG: hypothetical protein KF745_00770 [Phycisphaeraceae bacterium]|nr:hypothetical protein [Phycisphaeraceae bacterium]